MQSWVTKASNSDEYQSNLIRKSLDFAGFPFNFSCILASGAQVTAIPLSCLEFLATLCRHIRSYSIF